MQNLPQEREIASLRLRFQANNRLRLEFLGTLSKILRDYGEPVSDGLLDSIVLATPNELADLNKSYEAAGSKRPGKRRGNGVGTGPPQQNDEQGPPQHKDEQGPPQHKDVTGPPQQNKKKSKKGSSKKGTTKKGAAKKSGRSRS
jgi:hypothetical protein